MNKLFQRSRCKGAFRNVTMLFVVVMTIFLGSFSANAQSNNWKSADDAKAALKPVIVSIEESSSVNRDLDPQAYANDQARLNLCNTIYDLIYRSGKSPQEAFNEATSVYNNIVSPQGQGIAGTSPSKSAVSGNSSNAADVQAHSVFAPQGLSITVNPVPGVRSLLTF